MREAVNPLSSQELNLSKPPEDKPHIFLRDGQTYVSWPWLHTPPAPIPEKEAYDKDFYSRNDPLLLPPVQRRLGELTVAWIGLSVGGNSVFTGVQTGIQNVRIGDPDEIARSNLQRLARAGEPDIGRNKTDHTREKLYELYPYLNLKAYREGLTQTNIHEFLDGCDVIVEETDDPKTKLLVRENRGNRILIMGSDLGLRPTIDVEQGDDPPFHGRLTDKELESLKGDLDIKEKLTLFTKIIGIENMPMELQENFLNILKGKENHLTQLGATAAVVAGKIASNLVTIAQGHQNKLPKTEYIDLQAGIPLGRRDVRRMFQETFLPTHNNT